MERQTRLNLFTKGDLYVVITEAYCAGRSSLEVLKACLDTGVRIVQLREKSISDHALYSLACQWRDLTAAYEAAFIVDDRVDIALAAEADGVHLGDTDLPLVAARQMAPGLLLGASTHSLEEALHAQSEGADYVNIGPVFPTQTKQLSIGAVGPELIKQIRPHLHIPFTCMGGIKPGNIGQVLAAGAQIVAVVTAVTAADDIAHAVFELRGMILKGRKSILQKDAGVATL